MNDNQFGNQAGIRLTSSNIPSTSISTSCSSSSNSSSGLPHQANQTVPATLTGLTNPSNQTILASNPSPINNPSPTNAVNCVSYRRVSTQKQVIEGEGLDIQLDRIKSFCQSNGYSLMPNHDFIDEGVSGAKEAVDREGIMSLLAFCKELNSHPDPSRRVHHVVVDKVDRLSRELFQQLFIEKQLLVLGVTILYSAQETLNSTSEADRAIIGLMRQMMGAFAEFERTLIKQRLSDGIKKKASKGDRPTGRQPFGYGYDDKGHGTVVNEAEAAVVREIFLKRSEGMPLQRIADYLERGLDRALKSGFNECNQARRWSKQAVRVILTNDFYLGIMTHDGKKQRGNHAPIVDRWLWDGVHGHGNWTGGIGRAA